MITIGCMFTHYTSLIFRLHGNVLTEPNRQLVSTPTGNQDGFGNGLKGFRGSSRKAGLAFPKYSPCTKLFNGNHISWGHNWEGVRDGFPGKIPDFVPQCRGGRNAQLCNAMTSLNDVTHILGYVWMEFDSVGGMVLMLDRFNEPDKYDQDWFGEPRGTYSKTVDMWREKMQPHGGKFKLG
jgi:hypothetical protein